MAKLSETINDLFGRVKNAPGQVVLGHGLLLRARFMPDGRKQLVLHRPPNSQPSPVEVETTMKHWRLATDHAPTGHVFSYQLASGAVVCTELADEFDTGVLCGGWNGCKNDTLRKTTCGSVRYCPSCNVGREQLLTALASHRNALLTESMQEARQKALAGMSNKELAADLADFRREYEPRPFAGVPKDRKANFMTEPEIKP
jgi:hypothetical protein